MKNLYKKILAIALALVLFPMGTLAFSSNTFSTTLVSASQQAWTVNPGTGLGPTSAISISMWVNFTTDASGTLMSKALNGASQNKGYEFDYQGSGTHRLYFIMIDKDSGGARTDGFTSFTATTGTWYHLVVTSNCTNNITFYVNGVAQTTTYNNQLSTQCGDSGTEFAIGAYDFSGSKSNWVNGQIDEVLFYNTAITSGNVTTNYTTPCTPFTTGAVSEWHFDNNGNDSIGSNTLTNVNTATFTSTVAFTCPASFSFWQFTPF